jgi:hypothetical protein
MTDPLIAPLRALIAAAAKREASVRAAPSGGRLPQ